jgi:branched-subunit amino acid aminotransferase/4-amino-4-deoxychorismate lyase
MLVTASPMQPYPAEFYEKGMTVVITDYKQNPDDPIAGHKTINYFPRLMALQRAQAARAGEALWFTTTNYLAEGSVSNVFVVKDNVLLTPPRNTPVLPGVVRALVLELAQQHETAIEERPLTIKDLLGAEEVFLTNSIMELMPVCWVEKHAVGAEKPGPMYKQFHQWYRQAVEEQCRQGN